MQIVQTDQLVGKKLGVYQVQRLLGQGQLSAVYMAQHVSEGTQALVTIYKVPDGISSRTYIQFSNRFAQESATLVRMRHPHILPIYDFGVQDGNPYVVTAYARGASLAQVLKKQTRLTPEQTLELLKQLAYGLDYAHSLKVTHGMLSLSNVLVNDELKTQIAGFGLNTLLEAHRDTRTNSPYAHLMSATGAFLGSAATISPEQVQGMSSGSSADIYALGVMLFELLSGSPPFRAATSLETALQRMQQPIPSLHALCPDVPAGLDLVIGRTTERDPARRYQIANDVARAVERVIHSRPDARDQSATSTSKMESNPQNTLPLTINWKEEAAASAAAAAALPESFLPDTDHAPVVSSSPARPAESLPGVDPFAWWSANSAPAQMQHAQPGTFVQSTQRSPIRSARNQPGRRNPQQERRQLVKLIATGTAVAGVFAVGGISFARFVDSIKQAQQYSSTSATGSTAITQGTTPSAGVTGTTQKTPAPTHTATPKSTATKTSQPTPTPQTTQQATPGTTPTPQATQPPPPPPTPTPPPHTGTVIGSTSQATNSSVKFTNPADGSSSLLIHLSNGNFVACERACTHAGVPVDYNSGQQQLTCPAHGAVFDPLNGFAHLSGPGGGSLPSVTIHVNADGTITV